MRQRVYAGFISGQTAQKSPSTLYAMTKCGAIGFSFTRGVATRRFLLPAKPAFYIESPRTAACAVRQSLPPMWRTRVPAAFAPPGICGNAPSTRRKRLCPSTCVVFDGIVSFFVCAAFDKRLQIVKQKDGPCGTAFALDAIRSAAWRPFCTSPQSRRACPQSAAPRAARAV